jgi:hypothetical protein
MRIIVTALAVAACWGLVGAQEKKDDAKKADGPYKNEQGGYSIQFPANAKVKTDNKNTKDGAPMHAVIADCGQGKTCVVIYLDVPDVNKNLKTFFEAAKKKAAENGEVKNAMDVPVPKESAGHEFEVVCKDGRMLKTRLIIYNTRTYTIVFGADAKTFPTDEAKKVLESFEITK